MAAIQGLILLVKIIGCYFDALWRLLFPPKPKSVQGKLVLITGGGKGIGRTMGFEFAKHGANIVLWDVDKESNDQTAEDISGATGVMTKAYVCDVTDYNQVKATAAKVRQDMGEVDILINNAGLVSGGPILDRSEARISRILDVNILSHFWTIKEFLPHMLGQDYGHIVGIASIAGYMTFSMMVDYCTTKYAVRGMCDTLRDELRIHYKTNNVHVSVVCPTFTRTKLVQDLSKEVKIPMSENQWLNPDYVAKEIVGGVLTNKQLIFVPPSLRSNRFIQVLLPRWAQEIMNDASGNLLMFEE